MPLWAAIVIFVVFLAIAIVGIVVIINSVLRINVPFQILDTVKDTFAFLKPLI